jgi:dipeptidyl-peptidase 4
MRYLACVFICAITVCAQKKPVTLETLRATPEQGRETRVWAPNGRSFAIRTKTELKIYDVPTQTARTLLETSKLDASAVKPPSAGAPYAWTNRNASTDEMTWSADGKWLLSPAAGDLFLVNVANAKVEQLTRTPEPEIDPKFSPDGRSVLFRRGWDLFTLDLATKKETRLTTGGSETLRNGGLDWVYPEEIGLSTAFWWSPDSRSVAYLQFDTSMEPLFPHEDLLGMRAVFEPERYPQAGDHNATVRLGIVATTGGATHWLDAVRVTSSELLARVGWMPDSRHIYVVRTNRVQNHLEMLAIDVQSGKASTILTESDPYWLNLRDSPQFIDNGKHFLWTSERTGYRHIYLYSNDGEESRQLTRGEWEVTGIAAVDEPGRRVFYTSTEPSHLEHHLYVIAFDGEKKRRLTAEPGTHDISMGPTGAYYLDTFSSLKLAPRTVLYKGDGTMLAVYREPDPRETEEYEVLSAEIVTFPGADGTRLYGRLIRPAAFDPTKKYPVVVDVYGGPDVTLPVHNAWPGINMDQVLAQHGYVVWQAENRGGSGRGHAFEISIYHKLGVTELADQVAGVKYLISLGFVDPARVGIRGHSYGGFMTANALLRAPDVFHAGFAGAPVTDWNNYDTIYTERYMGLPADNSDGYRQTALPRYAANLRGKLMVAHNFEDDNVLFQNSMQLFKALQTAGKQFEMMLYPQKTHGITGADAYHEEHLMLDFFDRTLK